MMANGKNAIKELAECERIEKTIGADPVDILYSEKSEDYISYKKYVLEVENDADDFLFLLAGNKGETIETLKKKTVSDLNGFYERLAKPNNNA